ncbi:MAG: uroporphyrinogen-III synthase [Pseudomonadota bacterium]
MKVIVTRPSPDAEIFAREAASIGAEPVLSPVMAIRVRETTIDLAGAAALAFTSANGVRAFAALSPARDLKAFAVGAATAEAARGEGFREVEAAEGDVESLSRIISKAKLASHILHLAGSERTGDLVRQLSAKGIAARREVIYDALEIEDLASKAAAILADEGENPFVVFFSPRSARLFLRQAARAGLTKALRGATALCLSAEIAAAVAEAPWSAVLVAQERTSAAMLRLIADAFAERKGRTGAPR